MCIRLVYLGRLPDCIALSIVSAIRATDGMARSSRASADGSGMCGVVICTTGLFRL